VVNNWYNEASEHPISSNIVESPAPAAALEVALSTLINGPPLTVDVDMQSFPTNDMWPFSPDAVDIVGSPKLSRLFASFAALNLNSSLDISTFSLPPPAFVPSDHVTCQYLSRSEFMDLCHIGNKKSGTKSREASSYFGANVAASCSSTKRQMGQAPLKFTGVDVWFPSGNWLPASPFNELYPFPTTPPSSSQSSSISRKHIFSLQMKETEYSNLLGKLRPLHPKNDLRIIKTMECLADLYYKLEKYAQAEQWYGEALAAREEANGASSSETLWSRLNMINAIVAQGRYLEIQGMHQETHSIITRHFTSHYDLVLNSIMIKANIHGSLGSYEDEEICTRQLVQISLSAFGPKHQATLNAFAELGNSMGSLGRYAESEQLLNITLQLSHKASGVSDARLCTWMRHLAHVLNRQKRSVESIRLSRVAAERATDSLGEEHPDTLRCFSTLARILRNEGHLQESQELLRKTVRLQSKVLGEGNQHTIDSTHELGQTLMAAKRYQEATTWFEKSFPGHLELLGPEHGNTILGCDYLGRCYEKQRRNMDALALYEELIDKIRSEKGGDHPAVPEIQGWIDWNSNKLNEGRKDSEECVKVDNEEAEEIATNSILGFST
jgi:tetratricopeptide (TPR) repeat protein